MRSFQKLCFKRVRHVKSFTQYTRSGVKFKDETPEIFDKQQLLGKGGQKIQLTEEVLSDMHLQDADENDRLGAIYFYQFQLCPYSGKVKALMDYHCLNYHMIEVNPYTKDEIKWSSYQMVPILRLASSGMGKSFTESAVIIEALLERLTTMGKINEADSSLYSSPAQEKWHEWVDHQLIPRLFPNMFATLKDARATCAYLKNKKTSYMGSLEARYLSWTTARRLYTLHHEIAEINGIKNPREELVETISEWTDELRGKKTRLHGGRNPDLADLVVFGALRTCEESQTMKDLLANETLRHWYAEMSEIVGECNAMSHTMW
eukprot:272086_1